MDNPAFEKNEQHKGKLNVLHNLLIVRQIRYMYRRSILIEVEQPCEGYGPNCIPTTFAL